MRERVAQKPTTQMRRMGAKDPMAIPSAASTFSVCGYGKQAAQDSAFEESVED